MLLSRLLYLKAVRITGTTLVWNDDDSDDDWVPVDVDGTYDLSTIHNGRFVEHCAFKLDGIGPDQINDPHRHSKLVIHIRG